MTTQAIHFLNGQHSATYDVWVHSAGCADVARSIKSGKYADAGTAIVSTKREAHWEYNADFIYDGDESDAWPLTFAPCVHLPIGDWTCGAVPLNPYA